MKTVAEVMRESLALLSEDAPAIAAMASPEQHAAAAARERLEDAAPELLDACKFALESYRGLLFNACGKDDDDATRDLEAAIAKAEGQA